MRRIQAPPRPRTNHPARSIVRRSQGALEAYFAAMRAGSDDGRLSEWQPTEGDANAVTLEDLPKVRARSRDASLNNPIAQAVRRVMADHVIGRGLKPQCLIDYERLGISEKQAQDWQGECESFYERESKRADVTGRNEMPGLQRLVYLSAWDGGDVFPSFPMVADDAGRVGTRINLIEAERVDTPPDRYSDPSTMGGVQVDNWGRPIGFHVYRGHPGDLKPKRDQQRFEYWAKVRNGRVNVMQLSHQERIGQARGIPHFAQALPLLDHIHEHIEDTVLASQIQTRMAFFLKVAGNPIDAASAMATTKSYETLRRRGLAPASVNIIRQGDDIGTVGPTTPGQYWDPLIVRLQRVIAACIGAPYEVLFGDVSDANYSSIRAATQSFRKKLTTEQDVIIPALDAYWHHTIYEAWLDKQLGKVGLTIPLEESREEWARAIWIRPALGYIDPTKEASAFELMVNAGFMSRTEVVAEGGRRFEDVARQLAKEQQLLEKLGVKLGNAQAPQPAERAAPEQDQADESESKDDTEAAKDQEESK